MTIEMPGLVAAQNRIADLQARLGLSSAVGASTTSTTSTTAGANTGSTGTDTGAFASSMRKALATSTSATVGTATAAAPFVYDPSVAPGDVAFKPGAAQALAGRAATTATALAPATVAPATSTAPSVTAPSAATTAPTAVRTAAVARAAEAVPVAAPRLAATAATTRVAAASRTSRVDEVIADAKKYLGVPYRWGGTNPAKGLDCSGFVQLVFKQNGVSLPRVARDQQRMGTKVASLAQARPGDLITFGKPAHHIGIYLGNNKFIHAPHTGDVVKISKVYATPSSIRRVLPASAWSAGSGPVVATTPARSVATTHRAVASTSAAAAAAPSARAAEVTVRSFAAGTPDATGLGHTRAAAHAGWAGAPADDTWGAASAEAASLVVTALVASSPAVAPPTASPSAVTGAHTEASAPVAAPRRTARVAASGAGAASPGSVLAQAPAKYRAIFTAAGAKYGVSPELLAAVAKQESGFTATAVSHAGARGLMQLMPGTARSLGVRNSFDPAQAVDGAARLLRDHLKTFKGSTELALAAYNAGPGAVRRYGGVPPYGETQNYVRKIMANLRAGVA